MKLSVKKLHKVNNIILDFRIKRTYNGPLLYCFKLYIIYIYMEVTNMAKWSERIEKIVKENQEMIDLFHEFDKRITHYRDAGEYKRYTQLFDNMCNILIRLESEDAFNAVMLKVFWKQPYFSKLLELLREKRTKELKEEEKQEIEDECAIVDTFYDQLVN